MNFYIALRVPETWVVDSAIPFDSDSQTAPARLLELFKGWSDGLRLRDIIRAAEPNFILRRLVCMDPEMRWEGEGVTFLGDAAHVMSSFAGKGANLAIIDAAELGYALAGGDVKGEGKYASVREAVAAYEKRMFPRAEGAAKESALNMELFISDLVPMSAVDRMKEVISRGPGVP
jgi:2-polyprenyl-6-methoxyphenol hydroxylase-like FAD-dependent oxidoreductase